MSKGLLLGWGFDYYFWYCQFFFIGSSSVCVLFLWLVVFAEVALVVGGAALSVSVRKLHFAGLLSSLAWMLLTYVNARNAAAREGIGAIGANCLRWPCPRTTASEGNLRQWHQSCHCDCKAQVSVIVSRWPLVSVVV